MLNRWRISMAARHLALGHVIAYPTEAVWGLGCDPMNREAVLRLLQLKNRAIDQGLILVAADISQFSDYLAGLDPVQRRHLDDSWPGFHTWLVPHRGRVPQWISGNHSTVALRVSAHPLVQSLCRAFAGPIVSTSANITGKPAATSRLKIRQYFADDLDYIVPGKLGGEKAASRITELASGVRRRG